MIILVMAGVFVRSFKCIFTELLVNTLKVEIINWILLLLLLLLLLLQMVIITHMMLC